jgi:hypothetical protein
MAARFTLVLFTAAAASGVTVDDGVGHLLPGRNHVLDVLHGRHEPVCQATLIPGPFAGMGILDAHLRRRSDSSLALLRMFCTGGGSAWVC